MAISALHILVYCYLQVAKISFVQFVIMLFVMLCGVLWILLNIQVVQKCGTFQRHDVLYTCIQVAVAPNI